MLGQSNTAATLKISKMVYVSNANKFSKNPLDRNNEAEDDVSEAEKNGMEAKQKAISSFEYLD